MIDLPARKMRTAHLPLFTFSIGGQHKSAFTRAHQNSHFAHPSLSFSLLLSAGLSARSALIILCYATVRLHITRGNSEMQPNSCTWHSGALAAVDEPRRA